MVARRLPIVPGHQIVGRVEALGRDVSDWTLGERAGVTWLAGACGHCARCREGRENLCEFAMFTRWELDPAIQYDWQAVFLVPWLVRPK
ncbi:MAG: alcohol dehydrogenase catalytic domain-containing protein [Actinomycetota bacterium]|nr:alcohol dehydrogenase catalytic domain-containing protein [Actinomycetota bacterium]